ncbi:hypothetical protein EDC02_4399 [Micromonospora sp. Llam0]|uniref:hypothetical protein n=1 Tax=Micromonospora sp. Llam0 TaxID=2485143 RepID=UPI000FABACA2|nr:hypothetical protein [Micromonospora sp. Llam0]ROO62420.1 hypothetical protein EDC02_4399 [Micromonospora sp. Llam0]
MGFSRSAVLRRWYFITLALGFIALALARLTILGGNRANAGIWQSSANIADNMLAATLTSLIVGGAYVYLYPLENEVPHEVVRSVDIAGALAEQTRPTRNWAVRSRSANYFTTITLREIANSALSNGRAVSVRILVIDPDRTDLLAAYSHSMSNTKSRVGAWSVRRARFEVMASLLRAALQVRKAPRVEVTFGLAPYVWVMSLDLSDIAALVTGQNKGEDALIFRNSSSFYRSYCDDFDASWAVARKVRPVINRDIPSDPNLLTTEDLAELRSFFEKLQINQTPDEDLLEIVRTLGRRTDYD